MCIRDRAQCEWRINIREGTIRLLYEGHFNRGQKVLEISSVSQNLIRARKPYIVETADDEIHILNGWNGKLYNKCPTWWLMWNVMLLQGTENFVDHVRNKWRKWRYVTMSVLKTEPYSVIKFTDYSIVIIKWKNANKKIMF